MNRRTLLASGGVVVLPQVFRTDAPAPYQPADPPALPPMTQTVGFFGDSITAGGILDPRHRLDVQFGQIADVMPSRILNKGVGGQLLLGVGGLAENFDTYSAPLVDGDVAVITIGMNDLFSYGGDQAWTSTHNALVFKARQRGLHVLLGHITNIGSSHWAYETQRQELNQWLDDVYGACVVRFANGLNDQRTGQTWIDQRFSWYDGIHPNEGGTRIMAQMVSDTLHAAQWWRG
jgi:lysophospholipase L1-like esterase